MSKMWFEARSLSEWSLSNLPIVHLQKRSPLLLDRQLRGLFEPQGIYFLSSNSSSMFYLFVRAHFTSPKLTTLQIKRPLVLGQRTNQGQPIILVSFRRLLLEFRPSCSGASFHATRATHFLFVSSSTPAMLLRQHGLHSKSTLQTLTEQCAILVGTFHKCQLKVQNDHVQLFHVLRPN